jgi:hypothetical protein
MTLYPNIIYHPDSGMEIFIDTLQRINNVDRCELVTYISAIDGSLETFKRSKDPRSLSLSGKIFVDNENTLRRQLRYLLGEQVYLMLGAQNFASLGKIESFDFAKAVGTVTPLTLDFICDIETEGQFYEAEDVTVVGSGSSIASDSFASGGSCVQLIVQNGSTYWSITQSDYQLPMGDYKVFARVKDSNQVTDDLIMTLYNYTDSTTIGSTTKTCTGSYALYESDIITIASDDLEDQINIIVGKNTAITNTLSLDFIGIARVG